MNGITVTELSALAYKDNTLFALGDRGVLFHFDIEIQNKKIKKLSLVNALRLQSKKNKNLKKSKRDSEGLCFINDDLLISFERKPRVEVFSRNGKKIKTKKIHKDLRKVKNYRSKNKALESVAYNEKYGVITSPEKSLKSLSQMTHVLYAKKDTWEIPSDGSITALEFIDEDKLMILQRNFNMFSRRYVITISVIDLKTSQYRILTQLQSKDGWRLDNFEGLTKVANSTYLMVSDDNDSFYQDTLLVLFELYL
jgi:hypothetical protein